MAKQSFVTGQVLTAAQLTSLQQTAMSGGAASAKTANYTLVASDAGTAISMTSTSATTITVNTGLFAAGDTVFIQNLGTGLCTITAGTATVNTAGSLILPQYDAGILYFVSASSAVFYDYIQVGAASPLTTKGDLYTFGSSDTRIGVGANDTVLTADSSTATGLKWAAPGGAGANWTLLNSGGTALTGADTITVSGISGKDKIMVLISEASAGGYGSIGVRLNTDTGSNYFRYGQQWEIRSSYNATNVQGVSGSANVITISETALDGFTSGGVLLTGCNSSGVKVFQSSGSGSGTTPWYNFMWNGYYNSSSTISSISVRNSSGSNFDNGTVYVYTSA
jgi:hypothetical protein